MAALREAFRDPSKSHTTRMAARKDRTGALFRPTSNNGRSRGASIVTDGVYKMLATYAAALQIEVAGFGPHALRASLLTRGQPSCPIRRSRVPC